MNKVLKYAGSLLFGALMLTACSPDSYDGPDLGAIPVAANYEDCVKVTVDQATNYAYFHFNAAPGVTPVWIIDGSSYNGEFTAKKYYRKAGTYSVQCKVKNRNGISDGAIERKFTVEKTKMNGFGGFDTNSDYNLFKGATMTQAPGFYAPGWSQIADPVARMSGTDFSITLPEATTDQWQAQVPFTTNISTTATAETYDFSVILTCSTDHPGVTVKFTNPNDDNDFYFAERVPLKAGEPFCYYETKLPSRDIQNLKLFIDFGGNPAGAEFVVENLVFIPTSKNDIEAPEKGEPEPVWVDVASADNLWNQANPTPGKWYYAPNWAQIADPTVKESGRSYSFTLPEATYDRWQAQFPIETTLGIADDTEYDFLAIIESSTEFKALVKLTDASDDNNFFFAKEVKLTAGGETRFFVKQAKLPSPCEKLKLFFDFGFNPANTDIVIKDIIIQKHRE